MAFALLPAGRLIPVPPVEVALRGRRIVGSPTTVRAGIEAAAEEYTADAARRRSYELIAEEFGLVRSGTGPAALAS